VTVIFDREPVLILGLIRAIVVMAVSFGLALTVEQMAAVYLVAEMVISVIARSRVTPAE